ncbi:MAG: hypothetical protein N4A72_00645 [Bacteroidales bacterium]|jgi:hypothetical protein|nr:hypothetical protein [Bacteroidales bacterium]
MQRLAFKFLTAILLVLFISSCDKDDIIETFTDKGSATVSFRGKTFSTFDEESFGMTNGMIAVTNSTDDYQLTVVGVGSDGATVDVCNNCDKPVAVQFSTSTWGTGLSAIYTAFSGTVKRSGKTLTIDAQMSNDGGQTFHTLSATVNVTTVINL